MESVYLIMRKSKFKLFFKKKNNYKYMGKNAYINFINYAKVTSQDPAKHHNPCAVL